MKYLYPKSRERYTTAYITTYIKIPENETKGTTTDVKENLGS